MTTKTKAHTRYRDAEGNIVPGTTTILGILNKPALVKWANNLGLQGIDSSKYRDEMADIGTLAHYMILSYYKGTKPDTSEYSAKQIELADNCLLSFYEWEKGHAIIPILVEEPLVSEVWKYGGQIDLYCKLDGVLTLVDFKTGKAIYPEMMYQLAAYRQLLIDNGHQVDQCRILRIGRDEDEGFEERVKNSLFSELNLFSHCLEIYKLQKEIRKENK